MYDRGYGRVLNEALFRLIDWMVLLPEALEAEFCQELFAFEEERQSPYVTSVERAGIEKRLQQGEARIPMRLIASKFCPESAETYRPRIESADARAARGPV